MPDAPSEIEDGKVRRRSRQFNKADFDQIAEYVIDEYQTRKRARTDLEKQWDEIDRQIDMIPDVEHKKLPNGKPDIHKMWMSEMELPLQAQTLEILTADARRMQFPSTGPAFAAHAETTDDYLEKTDFSAIIKGDRAEVPSVIDQDNADKLAGGFLRNLLAQYNFPERMDRINAEAFRYSMGIGRGRMETKNVFIHESKGTRKETHKIPVLVPGSVRNTYLDKPIPSIHSAQVLGDSHIAVDNIKLEALQIAANKGSNDPNDEDGGWMPGMVRKLAAEKDGNIRLLEMEGDVVVPRKTVRSVVIPGAIVTVAMGGKEGEANHGVVRFRFRKQPYSSYLLFPYHYESAHDVYGTSPLRKGRTVQIMAVQALNRIMDSAALKNTPPVGYDRTNLEFTQKGGPVIHPGAIWETTDPVTVYDEIGGDPQALLAVFSSAIQLYAELTGILAARVGAQTVSHTTAFAKDAELQRGAVRTVDYVNTQSDAPLPRWCGMAYDMGRRALGNKKASFYIEEYGGFVEVSQEHLPENAIFEWFGASGPAEAAAKWQSKMQSASVGMQLDQLSMSQGNPPTLVVPELIKQILREGGWSDLDQLVRMAEQTSAFEGETSPGERIASLNMLRQFSG